MISRSPSPSAERAVFAKHLAFRAVPRSWQPPLVQPSGIRLLKFITFFAIGGTEQQVLTLGKALDPSRFGLRMACLGRRGGLLKEIEASGIPVSEYKIKSLYRLSTFKQQCKFARYLRHHRIQILHTYSFYPNVFAIPAARLSGVPVIVASIRDTGEMWTSLQRRAQKVVCRLADGIVVNAEAIKQRLIVEGYSQEQITVIHNGIACSRFQGNGSRAGLRRELGLPLQAPLVAVLCRLHPIKRLEYFLEAAGSVAARAP